MKSGGYSISFNVYCKEACTKEKLTFDSDGKAERILNITNDLMMHRPPAKFGETLPAFIDEAEQLNSIDRLNLPTRTRSVES